MGTAIKHPMPDRVKPSFVIFDIRALWRLTYGQEYWRVYRIYSQMRERERERERVPDCRSVNTKSFGPQW